MTVAPGSTIGILGGGQLGADGAGQVGVRRLPKLRARVAEHGGPELGEGLVGCDPQHAQDGSGDERRAADAHAPSLTT